MAIVRLARHRGANKTHSFPRGAGRVKALVNERARKTFLIRVAKTGPSAEVLADTEKMVAELKAARNASFLDQYRVKA